jgi:hypothetical protein
VPIGPVRPGSLAEKIAISGAPSARCRSGNPRRAFAFGLGAERHHQIDVRPQHGREHSPVRLRPLFVGAGGRVQQHAIRRTCGFGQRRAVEAKIRRAVRRVAQRRGGQCPIPRNRVLLSFHRVAHVIEHTGERLLDAVRIVAVAAAPCRAREQRRFEKQALCIDDGVIGAAAKPAHKPADVLPGRSLR